ncbi:unnamed protein product [Echinostoma caproni]|uniref:G_PROTEIN_RECEP_F3_4 domain-containing protein n=1 Tax=Echinostoma caproni TaxID=27848 RepID=A0A183B4P5_9TREM|nr:unnamed protein product [Echinostoma caproni]
MHASDALYYVQNTANSLYAVAEALKRCSKQNCSLISKSTPENGTMNDLLYYLKNFQYMGFGNGTFDFFKGIDGYPRYTIISYSTKYLRWEILAQYDGTLTSHVLNRTRAKHPYSHCSEPCGLGQARRPDRKNKCCWSCLNCTSDQIVTSLASGNYPDVDKDAFPPITMCRFCDPGKRPNQNKTICSDLPLIYMNIENGFAITVVVLCILALMITTLTCLIYTIHWNTPVVRASGRETTTVLLLAIFLSYIFPIVFIWDKPRLPICVVAVIAPGLCSAISYAAIYARITRIDRLFRVS